MDKKSTNLLMFIKSSISWMANRKPNVYKLGTNFVAAFWKVEPTQDSIYDMFKSKDDMEFYSAEVKKSFEEKYPDLCCDVKYNYGPVELEGIMYSRIVYYYYERKYDNVFFAC